MSSLYVQEVPKCLKDKLYTEKQDFVIKTPNGKSFANAFNYCKKCQSYTTKEGMEKDLKKVALDFFKTAGFSYKLSDIVEVKKL